MTDDVPSSTRGDCRHGSLPASPFRRRPFRVYWVGGLLSNAGTWLYNVTASVVIFDLTGSPFMVGLLNFATFAPIFAFSFLAGVLSDRVERRHVVITASAIALVAGTGLAALAAAGRTTPTVLLAVSFTLGSSYAFAKPALSALLPSLVDPDHLARAAAINTLQFTFGQVLGSFLSVAVLASGGPEHAFLINAGTYLGPITAMVILRSHVVQTLERQRAGVAALRQGLRFVMRDSGLLPIVLAIVLANGVVEAVRTLAPVVTDRALGLSSDDAGLLVGAVGLGSVIGALAFSRLERRWGPAGLARLGFGLQIVGGAGVATATTLTASCVAATLIGVGFAQLIPQLNATMLAGSPDAMRGRVMAAFAMAHLGLRPVWSMLAGWLGAAAGARAAIAILIASAAFGLVVLGGGHRLVGAATPPSNRRS